MAPHPVDIHVGKKLRLRRTILGMSQETVAKAIGITFQQVQKYERGINRMSASRLFEFSRLMDVPISFFFDGLENTPIGAAVSQEEARKRGFAEEGGAQFEHQKMASRETLEMMRAYYRISNPSVRRSIADMIRAVAEGMVLIEGSKKESA